jgi:hypothetical protein
MGYTYTLSPRPKTPPLISSLISHLSSLPSSVVSRRSPATQAFSFPARHQARAPTQTQIYLSMSPIAPVLDPLSPSLASTNRSPTHSSPSCSGVCQYILSHTDCYRNSNVKYCYFCFVGLLGFATNYQYKDDK